MTGKYATEILQGFGGILQVDGYAGYNRVLDLRDNEPIQLAYCWAHARRKLFDLIHHNVAPIAEEGLKQIAALYRIEKQARATSAEDRLALRQAKSAPKIATFKTWLDHARTQVSAKSPTGDALKYIAKYWDGLILFLTDGRIEMDSNAVERTIRAIPCHRQCKAHRIAAICLFRQNIPFLISLVHSHPVILVGAQPKSERLPNYACFGPYVPAIIFTRANETAFVQGVGSAQRIMSEIDADLSFDKTLAGLKIA